MILGTYSIEDLNDRFEAAEHRAVVTPQMRMLTLLKKAAEAGNALGKQGHSIKDVQVIVSRDYSKMPYETFTVRVVPDYKLKERAALAGKETK